METDSPSPGPSGHPLPGGERGKAAVPGSFPSPPRGEDGSRSEPGEGESMTAASSSASLAIRATRSPCVPSFAWNVTFK